MALNIRFLAVILGVLPHTESLQCYQCSNVTHTKDCHSNVACSNGQRCYTSTAGIGDAEVYHLGCKSEAECLSGLSVGLVGRSVDSGNKCFQCCNVDNCNVNLCSAGTQVISEVGPCRDDPNFDCAKVSSSFPICADVHHAKTICRKYCGLCSLVDGSWSDWSSWSSCDVTCGSGHVKRTRTCTNPAPAHGGLDCVGNVTETSTCVLGTCPVHGGWSLWSSWGYCSVTCGVGLERRDRSCSNPHPSANGDHCFGDSRDYRPCFTKACSDGAWSVWSTWGRCSASCLGGLQMRSRTCDNPTPTKFGHACVGNSEEYQPCNNKKCPADLPIAFRATLLSSTSLSASSTFKTLIYTNTELNIGGGYNNQTGIFTVPETGMYTFTVQTCISYNDYTVQILRDTRVIVSTHLSSYGIVSCESTTATDSLVIGNKISVRFHSSSNIYQHSDYINMFQGNLIRG